MIRAEDPDPRSGEFDVASYNSRCIEAGRNAHGYMRRTLARRRRHYGATVMKYVVSKVLTPSTVAAK